jgi:hypothetical protein
MKYLPKSIPGALVAGLYLLIVTLLLCGTVFGGGGLHGTAAMCFIVVFFLTSPLSWVLFSFAPSNAAQQNSVFWSVFFFVGLVVCALINTAIIYLVVGLLSRALGSLFTKSTRGLK